MKSRKQIIAAVAAVSVLSAVTGTGVFAANRSNEKLIEKPNSISEEELTVTEADVTAEAEETAEEVKEDNKEEAKPAPEAPVKPEDEKKVEEKEEAETAEDTEKEETEVKEDKSSDAEENAEKEEPVKPAGPKEIKGMIKKAFDFDVRDFKDGVKNEWFDFCIGRLELDKLEDENNKPEP
ncbi:hypothetical protein SAMN04487832_103256, partial [Ruminococcus sp. XPD3002]